RAQYDSLFGKLLKLPEETMVFPAHDYKGDMVSTIGEERRFNPRLQVTSVDEYVDLLSKLKLPNPKMMDVAVPANLRQGLAQDEVARKGWALTATEAMALIDAANVALVDLREPSEREKSGSIPGALHAPYPELERNIRRGGVLNELACATGKRIVFYCAYGERSAMAVQAAQAAGIGSACHIQGGIAALRDIRGPPTQLLPALSGRRRGERAGGELCTGAPPGGGRAGLHSSARRNKPLVGATPPGWRHYP